MKRLFERESSGVLMGLAWGAAGLVVGASAALLLTPKSGSQLRELIGSMFKKQRQRFERGDVDEERMVGEGGHEPIPPEMSDVGAH